MTPHPREREVYEGAEGLFGAELDSYLAEACGEDEALLDRVRRLIENSTDPTQEVSGLLETPDSAIEAIGIQEGDVVDGFKIIDVLGQGGFGAVYLAQQREPRRKIALKVIKPGMDSKEVLARFDAERQALAIMDHPGIAKVLHAGATDRGLPYFAMEYVSGGSITEAADQNRLDTEQRLKLMIKVCDAVQHAHSKAVIHRDLKPGNILVSRHDDGSLHPKVIDFGVAKAMAQRLTELSLHTLRGSLVGTPAYMSPEQANASVMDVDTQTDVYALGVILYELLTGRLPFDPPTSGVRKDELDFYERLQRDDPPKPSTRITGLDASMADQISRARRTRLEYLQKHLSTELDWIPLKAMKRDRDERYDSAAELRDDLRRYLDGEPILARPDSRAYRVRKFVAKRKVPLAIGGAFMLLLLGALVTVSVLLVDARVQRRVAEKATLEEKAATAEAESNMELAIDALDSAEEARQVTEKEKDKASSLAEQLRQQVAKLERATYQNAMQRVAELDARQRLGDLRDVLDQMNGSAAVERSELDWEWIWLRSRFEPRRESATTNDARLGQVVAVDPRTGRSLRCDEEGAGKKWWISGPDLEVQELDEDDSFVIDRAGFHPETGHILAACRDGALREFEVDGGRVRLKRWFVDTRGARRQTAWSDQGNQIRNAPQGLPDRLVIADQAAAVAFEDTSSVFIWSLSAGGERQTPEEREGSSILTPELISLSPDGRVLVTDVPGSPDAHLFTSRWPRNLSHEDGFVEVLAVSPGAERWDAVTGSEDGTISFWSRNSKSPVVGPVETKIGRIDHLACSPDGAWVLAVGGKEVALVNSANGDIAWRSELEAPITHSGFDASARHVHLRTESGVVLAFRMARDDDDGALAMELLGVYEDGLEPETGPEAVAFDWMPGGSGGRIGPALRITTADSVGERRGRGLAPPTWRAVPESGAGRRGDWCRGHEISWGRDVGLRFDGTELSPRKTLGDTVICNEAGDILVTVSAKRKITIVDLRTMQDSEVYGVGVNAERIDLSADPRWLVFSSTREGDQGLGLRSLESMGDRKIEFQELPEDLQGSWSVALSHDARFLAVVDGRGRTWVLDRDGDGAYAELDLPEVTIPDPGDLDVQFAKWQPGDDLQMLRAFRDETGLIRHADVIVWNGSGDHAPKSVVDLELDIDARGVDRSAGGRSDEAWDVAISPSGRRVAVQFADGTLAIHYADTGRPVFDVADRHPLDLVGDGERVLRTERVGSLFWGLDGSRIYQRWGNWYRTLDCLPFEDREACERDPGRRGWSIGTLMAGFGLPRDFLAASPREVELEE